MSELADISKSEMRVIERIAFGDSEKEIAEKLCLSPRTVHNHAYNIRKKLNARSAVDICRIFILSLDNPKQFFITALFLMIHINIMFSANVIDLRSPVRTQTRTVKTMRTLRRKN